MLGIGSGGNRWLSSLCKGNISQIRSTQPSIFYFSFSGNFFQFLTFQKILWNREKGILYGRTLFFELRTEKSNKNRKWIIKIWTRAALFAAENAYHSVNAIYLQVFLLSCISLARIIEKFFHSSFQTFRKVALNENNWE